MLRERLMHCTLWFYTFHEEGFTDVEGIYVLDRISDTLDFDQTLNLYFAERHIDYALLTETDPPPGQAVTFNSNYEALVTRRCQYLQTVTGNLYGADTNAADPTIRVGIYDCSIRATSASKTFAVTHSITITNPLC